MEEDSEDFEPLIFDLEEVECRMTDIEERDRSDEAGRSVKGSIFNSPKEFRTINPSRGVNDSSMLSSQNLAVLDNVRQIEDFLRYGADRNLDVTVSSVMSTPRHPYGRDMMDMSDNQSVLGSSYGARMPLTPSQFARQSEMGKARVNQQDRLSAS